MQYTVTVSLHAQLQFTVESQSNDGAEIEELARDYTTNLLGDNIDIDHIDIHPEPEH